MVEKINCMNKKALITGASKRMGKNIAIGLASSGWDIVLHYHRSEQESRVLAAELSAYCNVSTYCADLAKQEECVSLMESIASEMGTIDLLVNNAANFEYEKQGEFDKGIWQRNFDVNLRAPTILSTHFAAQYTNSRGVGNIINILDFCVHGVVRNFLSYSLSKKALMELTRYHAVHMAPGIRVNAIAPAYVIRGEVEGEKEFAQRWKSSLLVKKTTIDEVTRAINFILESESMTGEVITLASGKNIPTFSY
jgi:NAD(P)-dependent dehydrogenase (short-subunit alcohol dehydrogenase family)